MGSGLGGGLIDARGLVPQPMQPLGSPANVSQTGTPGAVTPSASLVNDQNEAAKDQTGQQDVHPNHPPPVEEQQVQPDPVISPGLTDVEAITPAPVISQASVPPQSNPPPPFRSRNASTPLNQPHGLGESSDIASPPPSNSRGVALPKPPVSAPENPEVEGQPEPEEKKIPSRTLRSPPPPEIEPDQVEIPPLPQENIPMMQPKPQYAKGQLPVRSSVSRPITVNGASKAPKDTKAEIPVPQQAEIVKAEPPKSVSLQQRPLQVEEKLPSLQNLPQQPPIQKQPPPVQKLQQYALQSPPIPEEGTYSAVSYHPPPLLPRVKTSDEPLPLHGSSFISNTSQPTRKQNSQNVSSIVAAIPPALDAKKENFSSSQAPVLPPKIPLPGLVTQNLPGQSKNAIFSPSRVPLPESAIAERPPKRDVSGPRGPQDLMLPTSVPLPESAVASPSPAGGAVGDVSGQYRTESLLKKSLEPNRTQSSAARAQIQAQIEQVPPAGSSPSTATHMRSESSASRRSTRKPVGSGAGGGPRADLSGLVELPATNDDDEPVMKAVSYPGDEWMPRWDGD
jgi:hypothetical protein